MVDVNLYSVTIEIITPSISDKKNHTNDSKQSIATLIPLLPSMSTTDNHHHTTKYPSFPHDIGNKKRQIVDKNTEHKAKSLSESTYRTAPVATIHKSLDATSTNLQR